MLPHRGIAEKTALMLHHAAFYIILFTAGSRRALRGMAPLMDTYTHTHSHTHMHAAQPGSITVCKLTANHVGIKNRKEITDRESETGDVKEKLKTD